MKHSLYATVISGLYLAATSAPAPYSKYWAPLDMPSRIREVVPGINVPGNKKSDGLAQPVPGVQIPNFQDGFNDGIAHYRPFDDQFATSWNHDPGDSWGYGLALQPINPLQINQDAVHDAIMYNGGIAPRFQENPLIGPLDPSIFGLGVGYAQENIDTNVGGGLRFPDFKSGNMFDWNGGISAKKKRVQGGFEAPILDDGYKWPFNGKVKRGTQDEQVSYGHSVNPTNHFGIPIDRKLTDYFMGKPAQTIPVLLSN